MGFVADHDGPLLHGEGELLVAESFVGRQDDTGVANPAGTQQILDALGLELVGNLVLLEFDRTQRAAVELQYRQGIGIEETLKFAFPVIQQRHRGHDQRRHAFGVTLQVPDQESQ
ncbi:hypothetical protein D3C76_965340 [compost metagenome]